MLTDDFYSLTKPAEWVDAPSTFSYSSLQAIKKCPLQWQLLHSRYGTEMQKYPARLSPAAVEGNIIHSVLEKLFRTLSLAGLPALGTPEFHDCVARVNIKKEVTSRIKSHDEEVAQHPRGSGFRLRSTAQQLANKTIRLFRQQYSDLPVKDSNQVGTGANDTFSLSESTNKTDGDPGFLLEKLGSLSEYKIDHPDIPFMGVVDFIFLEDKQPVIIDFKTGSESQDHLKQIMIYAVLWWRQTGKVPKRLEIRYPHTIKSLQVNERDLAGEEKNLCSEVDDAVVKLYAKPAKAICGEQCGFCDVRQFCEAYWEKYSTNAISNDIKAKIIDIEIVVDGQPTSYGFTAKTTKDLDVAVVFKENTTKFPHQVKEGQRLRILSVVAKDDEIIVKPITEIYHVNNVAG